MAWNNSSVDVGGGGERVVVEQGPAVLARLLVDPPAWLQVGALAVVVLAFGLAALGYHRNGGLDEAVLKEMGDIGVVVLSIAAATIVLVEVGSLPYLVDVLGGTAIGFVGAQLVLGVID